MDNAVQHLKYYTFMKLFLNVFKEKFCAEVDALKFGNPWEDDAMLTPLPEPNKPDYIQGLNR